VSLTEHNDEHGDEGSIVIGWVTKLVVTAAIFGVLVFDGISVGVAHLSTTDDANNAIQAASQSYEGQHSLQNAYNAAVATLNNHETISVKDFVIAPDGTTTLTVTNTVKTLILYRTKQSAGLAVVKVRTTGKYTGS
jgi:hypothetical protein